MKQSPVLRIYCHLHSYIVHGDFQRRSRTGKAYNKDVVKRQISQILYIQFLLKPASQFNTNKKTN